VKLLDIRVAAGDAGPVMMLSGEADITNVDQLENALNAQITAGARILTVDLSGLRFADSTAIVALVQAARTLKARGGQLDLTNPQSALAQTLALLGVVESLTVRDDETGPGPDRASLALHVQDDVCAGPGAADEHFACRG
jgi:anti-sigma B factor antagonist